MATRWLTLYILPLTVLFASCGLFKTRDPASPVQTNSSYNPPVDASVVFLNMQSALTGLNKEYYLDSFSSSSVRPFDFEPTPQARSQYTGVFLSWTLQQEGDYFDNMKFKIQSGSDPSLILTFTSVTAQSDSAQYDADYELTVPHTQAGIPKTFKGHSQFYLLRDPVTSYWYIWRWVDFQDAQNDTTWSDLKGAFAQ